MTATTAIETNRVGSINVKSHYTPGHSGFSAVNLLAAGVHGFLPPLEQPAAASSPQPVSRGLGPIDDKRAATRARAASGKADVLATLWVGVPFATVFLLGCLTLA